MQYLAVIAMLSLFSFPAPLSGDDPKPIKSFRDVNAVIKAYFDEKDDYRPGDLVTQDDVSSIISELGKRGWKVADQKEIVADALGDQDYLVKYSGTKEGKKFLRQVGSFKIIYDRLDRISNESGGQQLLDDIAKLPDGARYAKQNPGRAVPDLVDFLPKKRNGKTREVKNYDRPTGRLYTASQLVARLKKSYGDATAKKPTENGAAIDAATSRAVPIQ